MAALHFSSACEGQVTTIMHVQRSVAVGVGFQSYTEKHLATDHELVRNVLLALLASLAKVEAQKISHRTKADVARAGARGKWIGRPPGFADIRREIAERLATGASSYRVAKKLRVNRKTVAPYAQ